ncbi:haloacid dehalogenase type II [Alkalihalobacillus oceani]|uniref:haloacid dehalogenase type II n=1 Tax=Halalkalibacter oceani TaxID=1653776 RepID=UPI00203C8200|nr:haloacid dehalogenase type II [Halalkalibacter oceani]MCM3760112.1 haloacid dehalogenase type II [Halalkalibacter oceani]
MSCRLVTFDVFSALADIEGTFIPVLARHPQFVNQDVTAFFRMWRTKQYEYLMMLNSLQRNFLGFKEVTKRTLIHTLYAHQIELSENDQERLVQKWSELEFWEDARQTVERVKEKGYTTAMLSNGGQEMLASLQNRFGAGFDYIFSAEEIGCYKPAPQVYQYAYEQTGGRKEQMLHVAGSAPDIVGAISAGIPCAWANRMNALPIDLSYQPTYHFQRIEELLAYL